MKFSEKAYLAVQKVATDALRYDNEDSKLNFYAILAMVFSLDFTVLLVCRTNSHACFFALLSFVKVYSKGP